MLKACKHPGMCPNFVDGVMIIPKIEIVNFTHCSGITSLNSILSSKIIPTSLYCLSHFGNKPYLSLFRDMAKSLLAVKPFIFIFNEPTPYPN